MNYLKTFYRFLRDIYSSRRLLIDLAKNDFKSRYMGNYLGILWAFVQPTAMILIFWFVFQVGFKSMPVDNFPFILWLMAGMVPWFFFSESLQSATQSILANNFLVKKVVFRVSLLPIIQIISALAIHMFFILFLFGMFLYYGYTPTLYWLQIPYYLLCTILLVLGISWITSSVVVFFRDLGQIVGMIVQFGFWLTPIFWSLKILPPEYHAIIQYNPAYYLVEGYRDALINHVWFWDKPALTLQYWIITALFFFAGAVIFRKLRPHFADVL
ncbi:MAG TPA: ABC transporter permease [Sulfurovum sp.]|nr:MAG: teichoic acid ABC transporter permease [Sulfurovum sp. 35-42-20]OYZ24403.1 MAG: teichoic acid ABC transporter permease [Sulfurovum sp. 16-42-52]OYZ49672.1 MAG: teichoic acid ABC transporter permease [Sulfurovum sp. 24-42-9]OZA43036.1 MAG: teichoic acid ABC transporter permease [Sulfurovum sp. 17-42-90]OZA61527.1 MAG: teichoic acid ABC transporter permease [Sulfurovum sp. 39-42-12]HQR73460.1 ABC transporter permease [Sulfurovum sp.]